jgi:GT2 family glycosyltransferase
VDVSVVIINWKSKEYLRRCLESVYANTRSVSFEIIVADNASFDGSLEMVEREFPDVRFMQYRKNYGFGRANNLAARGATGSNILFLNPDTEILTDAIGGLSSFLQDNPRYGAVGCRLRNGDGSIQMTCARGFPTVRRQFNELAMLNRVFPWSSAFETVELRHWDHRDSRDVECISGACLMVRTDDFRELGGYDEQFFMYGEDVDLCYRMQVSGKPIRYLAGEQVTHFGGGSSAAAGETYKSALRQREANYYFMRKHYGRLRSFGYRAAVAGGAGVRVIASLMYPAITSIPGVSITGGFDAFKKYRGLLAWSLGLQRVGIPG